MFKKWQVLSVLAWLLTALVLNASSALAQEPTGESVATANVQSNGIVWQSTLENDGFVLTVSGPNEFHFQQAFPAGSNPIFRVLDENSQPHPDGSYAYELVLLPLIEADVRAALESVTEENRLEVEKSLREAGKMPLAKIQSGSFFITAGAIVLNDTDEGPATKDQVILDDLIVDGSQCVGQDCVNGESFGFDTIRLKENNLRIKFEDTSNSASFPSNDWQITINDSSNGGGNYFAVEDVSAGRQIFKVEARAPANSLYVDDGGRLGLGTASPVVDAHIVSGNTPTVRLEQNGSSGFTPQTWDLAGNEANFFIRDASNGSKLPFKIKPGAPTNSLYIEANGDVGLGTSNPKRALHLIGPDGTISNFPSTFGSLDNLVLENNGNSNIAIVSSDTSISGMKWYRNGANSFSGAVLYDHNATQKLDFRVEGSTQMTLDASGNAVIEGTVTANGVLLTSDVNAKENFVPIDGAEVLSRLADIPVTAWNFKDDDSVRHIGPTAQDFNAAFDLGQDEKHISLTDANGVTLAAVKSLHEQSQEKEAQIAQLQAQNAALEARLAALESAQSTGSGPATWSWLGLALVGLCFGVYQWGRAKAVR